MSDALEAREGLLVSSDPSDTESGTQPETETGDKDTGAVPGRQPVGSGWDMAPPVQIRVAIEAAEDDEDHESLDFRSGIEGGSCSEDDYSRSDKYSSSYCSCSSDLMRASCCSDLTSST